MSEGSVKVSTNVLSSGKNILSASVRGRVLEMATAKTECRLVASRGGERGVARQVQCGVQASTDRIGHEFVRCLFFLKNSSRPGIFVSQFNMVLWSTFFTGVDLAGSSAWSSCGVNSLRWSSM